MTHLHTDHSLQSAHNGHLSTVRALLDLGADVNATDLGDNTALHWAAMRGGSWEALRHGRLASSC